MNEKMRRSIHKVKDLFATNSDAPNRGCTIVPIYVNNRQGNELYARPTKINSEHPIYFSSKVFKGAELRYQKIESLAFMVVVKKPSHTKNIKEA